MISKNNFKNAFGEADVQFKNNVQQTLKKIEENEEINLMKKKSLRWAVTVAVACMMITTTAVAAIINPWGIFDFLSNRRNNVEILPDASQIVQDDVEQTGGQSELAAFTVRQAVFDGKYVYIAVAVKPANPKDMLLGTDAMPSDPIGNMGPLFADKNISIAEYALENNKTLLHTSVFDAGTAIIDTIDFILEDDGTLVYMLSGSYDGNDVTELPMELNCSVEPYINQQGEDVIDISNKQDTKLAITLKAAEPIGAVSCVEPVIYADCGVRVDKVTLTGTPMAIYVKIEFTVVDEVKYAETDGGLWFEFLDENGERIPDGAPSSADIESVDGSKTSFVQHSSFQASEILPNEITMRGYNCWDKNRYEAHTIDLK